MGIPLAVSGEYDEQDEFIHSFRLAVAGFITAQTISQQEQELVIDYVFAKRTLSQLALHRWVAMSEVTKQIDDAFAKLDEVEVYLKIALPDGTSSELLFDDVVSNPLFSELMW